MGASTEWTLNKSWAAFFTGDCIVSMASKRKAEQIYMPHISHYFIIAHKQAATLAIGESTMI